MGLKSKAKSTTYHHGDLAESLLEAVDHIARRFGLEAVTLRACAKLLGVAPSAGFRHYADKRALFTAFATRAQQRMACEMSQATSDAEVKGDSAFLAIGLAYVNFALENSAAFQVMWRSEMIYQDDPGFQESSKTLSHLLCSAFANTDNRDDGELSINELAAWSSVHGTASLLADSPQLNSIAKAEKLSRAKEVFSVIASSLG